MSLASERRRAIGDPGARRSRATWSRAPKRASGSIMTIVAVFLFASIASAKTQRELAYPYAEVWPAMLRFLRVDEKLNILEKDADAGYILFELQDGKKTFRGSAEVAKAGDATRVIITLKDRPSYMEEGLLERFEQKLKEEHP
jgi:hypothetical protein